MLAPRIRPFGVLAGLIALAGVALAADGMVTPLEAQRVRGVPESLLREVMPGADRFGEPGGDPPVIRAFAAGSDGSETLLGWIFLTSDLPPEQFGYSGPIEALVGLLPDGSITGVRVTDYMESYMRSMGDFLRTPGFQEQFAGKHIGDPFRLWDDVEGISRVSISVRALSRGVRDSARRVAAAYGTAPEFSSGMDVVDPVGRSWFELRQLGVVQRFEVTEPGEGSAGIALAYIENDRLGEFLLGPPLYERAQRSAERRGGAENLMLYAIDGSRLRLFRQQGWSIVQDGDTTLVDSRNVVSLGLPSGGVVAGEATMVGLMLVDGSVDTSRPFTFVYDLGELGIHEVEYMSQEARIALAEAEVAAAREAAEREAAEREAERAAALEPERAAADESGRAAAVEVEEEPGSADVDADEESATSASAGTREGAADSAEPMAGAEAAAGDAAPPSDSESLDFVLTEDETLLERTLAGTSWGRVAFMALVLALGAAAFFSKTTALRWVALTVTLVGLGFVDGGFLSVSHITSGIWAGVGVYARDLPLLLMVSFTVVTTLVWGRVFCGFLCPFGALQDVIERVVPKSLQRTVPASVHEWAKWVKYIVLAVIVVPPLLGSRVSVYQYFEPFGTVFFRSSDMLLWAIALVFLGASVVIPRFYCRYACPLGAALGLVSFVSLRRIRRVEQCSLCTVCEQRCPTGAIRKEAIDFPECVRCNVCEVQLIEKRGVCRHDMDAIRPRLVQIRERSGV